MKFGIDYWMLGVIEEAIRKRKQTLPEGHHQGCSHNCNNKWCDIGQCNLILRNIDEHRSYFTTKIIGDTKNDLQDSN